MRIGFDGTPLIGVKTGIGVYTHWIFRTLSADDRSDEEFVATAFTARGGGALRAAVAPPIRTRARPVPARLLRALWRRVELPPVEVLSGRVDVFHGTNYVLPPARHARGVVTIHDLAYLRYPDTVSAASRAYRQLVPRSLHRATAVCALTNAIADEIVDEYGWPRDRIYLTPPGVDPSWFDARPIDGAARSRLGLPERYVLAVGTLEPRKNLPLLLDAYARWRATAPDAPGLVLAGPAGWGPRLDLAALPAGSVTFTGHLDDDTLRRVTAGAACVAFPSRYEGFGIPPVEALACGVPVVASDLPVTREVLGDAATLVAPGDADALAAALLEAVRAPLGPGRRRRCVDQARQWTWARCAAGARAAYAAAVSG